MIYDRYYYSILNRKEKVVYQKLYDGITNLVDSVTFSMAQCVGVALDKICQYIALDNPHIFYADFGGFEYRKSFLNVEVRLSYWYTQDEIKKLNGKVNTVLGKMVKRVTGNSDYEKELSVHDLLIENVLYDDVALQNLPAHSPRSNTMLGVLFYKSAVCEGIAKTAKMLLNLLGIKCIVAVGADKKDGVSHAWNIVKIGGEAYHLDVTWDLQNSESDIVRHDYFNLTDKETRKDHEWTIAYPPCRSAEFNYFAKNGLIVHNAYELESMLCGALRKGRNTLGVKCSYRAFGGNILQAATAANEKCNRLYQSVKVLINEEQNTFTVIYS